MRLLIVAMLAFTLTGCESFHGPNIGKATGDLLILRATWKVPAIQAGVQGDMQEHVDRLDAALKTGDPLKVRNVLISLEPVYTKLRQEIESPTQEQVDFDKRVRQLWDEIHKIPFVDPLLLATGEWVLRRLVL